MLTKLVFSHKKNNRDFSFTNFSFFLYYYTQAYNLERMYVTIKENKYV